MSIRTRRCKACGVADASVLVTGIAFGTDVVSFHNSCFSTMGAMCTPLDVSKAYSTSAAEESLRTDIMRLSSRTMGPKCLMVAPVEDPRVPPYMADVDYETGMILPTPIAISYTEDRIAFDMAIAAIMSLMTDPETPLMTPSARMKFSPTWIAMGRAVTIDAAPKYAFTSDGRVHGNFSIAPGFAVQNYIDGIRSGMLKDDEFPLFAKAMFTEILAGATLEQIAVIDVNSTIKAILWHYHAQRSTDGRVFSAVSGATLLSPVDSLTVEATMLTEDTIYTIGTLVLGPPAGAGAPAPEERPPAPEERIPMLKERIPVLKERPPAPGISQTLSIAPIRSSRPEFHIPAMPEIQIDDGHGKLIWNPAYVSAYRNILDNFRFLRDYVLENTSEEFIFPWYILPKGSVAPSVDPVTGKFVLEEAAFKSNVEMTIPSRENRELNAAISEGIQLLKGFESYLEKEHPDLWSIDVENNVNSAIDDPVYRAQFILTIGVAISARADILVDEDMVGDANKRTSKILTSMAMQSIYAYSIMHPTWTDRFKSQMMKIRIANHVFLRLGNDHGFWKEFNSTSVSVSKRRRKG